MTNYQPFDDDDQSTVVKATVVEVIDRWSEEYQISETEYAQNETILFTAKLRSGADKGMVIEAAQTLDYFTAVNLRAVEPGDKVLLYTTPDGMTENQWLLSDYERFDQIIMLLIIFLVLLLVFGRWQGFNTIVSLALTCLAVFYVFIPAVLAGESIYVWSIVTCIYVTLMTLFIVNGVNRKSVAAILGCLAGVMVSAVLTLIMDQTMLLTGILDENSVILYGLRPEEPLNLRAIIFGSIIIGAVGAIMDVSISIAAALAELKEKLPHISFKELLQSGMTISRDIMGTMSNTLVLAFAGGSLSLLVLNYAYDLSINQVLNSSSICIEIMQGISGSIGVVMTVPIVSVLASVLVPKWHGEKPAAFLEDEEPAGEEDFPEEEGEEVENVPFSENAEENSQEETPFQP